MKDKMKFRWIWDDLDNDGFKILSTEDFKIASGQLQNQRDDLFLGYDKKKKMGIISLLEE